MNLSANLISGIILVIVGVLQILNVVMFPLWLILVCVGIMFITER